MHEFPILYVEDEENDVFLLRHALKQAGVTNLFRAVPDGKQAVEYLAGEGAFGDRAEYPLPGLLLLDLNLPFLSGHEVLRWVRGQPQFRALPVIVFTSSSQEKDIRSAYALGANSYVVKPQRIEDLAELVKTLRDYWLLHNRPAMNAGA